MQIAALNDLYRREAKEGLSGFGKRTISSGGGALAAVEDDSILAKRAKKTTSKIKCKACGQVNNIPSEMKLECPHLM